MKILAEESKSELVEIDRTVCHDTSASEYTYFVMKGIVDIYRFVRLNTCASFNAFLNEKLPNVKSGKITTDEDYEICALVGTLRTGSCFTPDERFGRSFTLVSKGTIIHEYQNNTGNFNSRSHDNQIRSDEAESSPILWHARKKFGINSGWQRNMRAIHDSQQGEIIYTLSINKSINYNYRSCK